MPESGSEYFEAVKDTVQSFWHGLSITLSYLMRRPITTQYPDRTELPVRDTLPPRYRGFLEIDTSICTGCQACERACPISCIQITLEKDAANPKQRVVSQFDIDEAKCMFCGLCVEPCPTGSIQHSREFEGSQRSVRNLTIRWADPEHPFPVYKVPKGADYYPRAPLGSLVRAKFDARPWYAPGPEYLPPEPPSAKPAAKPGAKPAAAAAAKPAEAKPAEGGAPTAKPAAPKPAPVDGAPKAAATAPTPATSPAPSPSTATSTTNSAPTPNAPSAPADAKPADAKPAEATTSAASAGQPPQPRGTPPDHGGHGQGSGSKP